MDNITLADLINLAKKYEVEEKRLINMPTKVKLINLFCINFVVENKEGILMYDEYIEKQLVEISKWNSKNPA